MPQHAGHSFGNFFGRDREGVFLDTRRSMLKAGMAGIAGLSLPGLIQARAEGASSGNSLPTGKSVILLWMAGGPSHIDTWDSKPDRPWINRGPFGVTQTKLPGVVICEHLPKQAAMLDKFTIIRSVDARHSNHEPNIGVSNGKSDRRTSRESGSRHVSVTGIDRGQSIMARTIRRCRRTPRL